MTLSLLSGSVTQFVGSVSLRVVRLRAVLVNFGFTNLVTLSLLSLKNNSTIWFGFLGMQKRRVKTRMVGVAELITTLFPCRTSIIEISEWAKCFLFYQYKYCTVFYLQTVNKRIPHHPQKKKLLVTHRGKDKGYDLQKQSQRVSLLVGWRTWFNSMHH